MEFSELIAARYSVRGFKPDAVEDDKLAKVLEAARLAPTAANYQPFQLIVVHTKGREAEVRRIYDRDWFVNFPLLICACAVPGQAWVSRDGKNAGEIDVAIVVTHMMLAAASQGLGTCYVASFDKSAAREILRLPSGVEPAAVMPLGYASVGPGVKERKPLKDLVRYEQW
jgi:nitroreductase